MRLILPPLLLLLSGSPLFAAGNLFPGGSFEAPVVKGRTSAGQGGDPTAAPKPPPWVAFNFENTGTNNIVTGGLTNEVARTGTQSLFINFDHVNQPYQSAILVSNFVPVVAGAEYHVGIWGRTDANDLINSQGRSAYLKLEVDFFAKDAFQAVGEPFLRVLPIPGSKDHDPYFRPDAWQPYFLKFTTPAGAVFAQITWRWETGGDPGEINGIMYFDDVTMTGPPNPIPNLTPAPHQRSTPAAEPTAQ
jgi:hypothetical protein